MRVLVDEGGLYLEPRGPMGYWRDPRPSGWFRKCERHDWHNVDVLDFTPAFPSFRIHLLHGNPVDVAPPMDSYLEWARQDEDDYATTLTNLSIYAWRRGVDIDIGWLREPFLGWVDEPGLPAESPLYRRGPDPLVETHASLRYELRGTLLFQVRDTRVRSVPIDQGHVAISQLGIPHFVLGRSLRIPIPPEGSGPISKALRDRAREPWEDLPTTTFLRMKAGGPIQREGLPKTFSEEVLVHSYDELLDAIRSKGITPPYRRRHRRALDVVRDELVRLEIGPEQAAKVRLSGGDVDGAWQVEKKFSLSGILPKRPPSPAGCPCHELRGQAPDQDAAMGSFPLRQCMSKIPSDREWQPLKAQCGQTGLMFYVQVYEDRGRELAGFELAPDSYERMLALHAEGIVAVNPGLLRKAEEHVAKGK